MSTVTIVIQHSPYESENKAWPALTIKTNNIFNMFNI